MPALSWHGNGNSAANGAINSKDVCEILKKKKNYNCNVYIILIIISVLSMSAEPPGKDGHYYSAVLTL
jgi:hypothetical protein